MPHRLRHAVFRFAVAFALLVCLVPYPGAAQPPFSPLMLDAIDAVRHARLAVAAGDSAHTHSDGTPAERLPGHRHGADAADHAHETANLPPPVAAALHRAAAGWQPHYRFSVRGAPVARLERPPRLAACA